MSAVRVRCREGGKGGVEAVGGFLGDGAKGVESGERDHCVRVECLYGGAVAVGAAFAVASSTDDEYAPRIGLRTGTDEEVTYYRIPQTVAFNFDVWGQSLAGGALSGAPFVISNSSTIREMTPTIACASSTSCVALYRWFDPADTTTDADRIKARALSY